MNIGKYDAGRGFLHPDKLKVAEKMIGRPLIDVPNSTEHRGVAEIRLCPYMYYCWLHDQMGYGKMRDYEKPIRRKWQEEGILKEGSYPEFTKKGLKFVEYILKWAYPDDYDEMVI